MNWGYLASIRESFGFVFFWRKNKAKGFILFEGGLLQGLVCFFFVFLVGVFCCSCLVVDGLLIGLNSLIEPLTLMDEWMDSSAVVTRMQCSAVDVFIP